MCQSSAVTVPLERKVLLEAISVHIVPSNDVAAVLIHGHVYRLPAGERLTVQINRMFPYGWCLPLTTPPSHTHPNIHTHTHTHTHTHSPALTPGKLPNFPITAMVVVGHTHCVLLLSSQTLPWYMTLLPLTWPLKGCGDDVMFLNMSQVHLICVWLRKWPVWPTLCNVYCHLWCGMANKLPCVLIHSLSLDGAVVKHGGKN